MNEPPRILHVISRLDGYGGSRALRYLAARQGRAGQDVAVAALRADDAIVRELSATGIGVTHLGGRWRFDAIALGRLLGHRRRMKCDIVHAWDPTALAYAAMACRGDTIVATWNDTDDSWVERLAGQGVATLPLGVSAAKAPQRSRDAVLADLGVPADSQIIAVAGPLVRRKLFDEAIWDYELVRVLHPQARLVVFGDGPELAQLQRYAALVSEPGCVAFPGFRCDLGELLPHVDVFWQRDAARTTPYALLEAMAAGVPAVAGAAPAHRAAIVSNESGFLVALGHRAGVAKATDELLSDAALARRMGDAAKKQVAKNFPMEAVFSACDALYDAVCPRSRVC